MTGMIVNNSAITSMDVGYAYGGAIYIERTGVGSTNATVNMTGGSIARNAAEVGSGTATPIAGGGVYIGTDGVFNMSGGSLEGNQAMTRTGTLPLPGDGGGVYITPTGTFNLNGGTISGNTATNNGNGVYVSTSDTLIFNEDAAPTLTVSDDVYLATGVTVYIGFELSDNVVGTIPLSMPDASVGRPVAECADSDTASNSVSYLSVSGYNPAVNPALLTEIILQL